MMNFLKKIKALFTKSDVEKTSLQKTARISIIFACIALVGVIIYFALIAPLLRAKNEYVPELFDGEVYQYSSIYILPVYERSQIKSVEIKNALDHYKLNSITRDSGELTFEIEGSEHISLDEELLSALLADVRVLVTNSPAGQERVTATATQEDLKNYGLDEASDPSWFEVSLVDGTSYRIYIGKSLVTTTGYYVRLEGRKNVVTDEAGNTTEYDIIYALQSSLADTVLKSSAGVVAMNLTPYVGDNIFSATRFEITRMIGSERELIIQVGLVPDQGIAASAQVYQMLYPKAYVINEDVYSEKVLMNLAYVQAYEIVAYGDNIHDASVYESFGLDLDNDRLDQFTDKNHVVLTFNCADMNDKEYDEKTSILYFSEKKTDLDGTEFYYVYSPFYEIVGKVLAETYGFVDWGISDFTNPYLFYEYFTSAEVIEIYNEREGLDLYFEITGKERSRHVDVMTSSSGGKDKVYTTVNGQNIPLVYDTKFIPGVYDTYEGDFEIFRDLYYVLITRKLALYADIDESLTKADMTKVVAKLAVTTSLKDHPISYHKYDSNGKRLTNIALRDEGGNILCSEVTVASSIGGDPIVYKDAYYDIQAKKFFRKTVDPNDGISKPSDFESDANGTVKAGNYLSNVIGGKYVETTYIYEFYDMFDTYVNANGETVTQLNPTYMYIIPSTVTREYSLSPDGERTLLSEKTETAELGIYIRTATINKLFSDTHKLLRGEQIDKMGVN